MSLSLDELGSVYKTPCVIFTGHPSLRCGDAVHFMEEWGSGAENAVMFTGKLAIMSRDYCILSHDYSYCCHRTRI